MAKNNYFILGSKCKNTVAIDTYDLLQAEDIIHCPVCGADSSHLDMVEN